jgi:hypothetical protein
LEGAKSGIQEDYQKDLDPQKHLNEGGGHPTREQHVLAVGKRLLSHIKLLGPRQRINIQLEENQKVINPQRSDLNNKTKDYRRKGNTTEAEELRKQKDQIPSRVWNDWGFRQMFYMQYANNILIIFIASKDEVLISSVSQDS